MEQSYEHHVIDQSRDQAGIATGCLFSFVSKPLPFQASRSSPGSGRSRRRWHKQHNEAASSQVRQERSHRPEAWTGGHGFRKKTEDRVHNRRSSGPFIGSYIGSRRFRLPRRGNSAPASIPDSSIWRPVHLVAPAGHANSDTRSPGLFNSRENYIVGCHPFH